MRKPSRLTKTFMSAGPLPAPTNNRSSAARFTAALFFVMGMTCAVGAQQRLPSGTSTTPTLQVSVRRVVVDIVVTDLRGKPVKGLAQQDFQVFEDRKPEAIRSFEEHMQEAQPPLPKLDLPANTFSNLSAAPQSGPVTVILYDLLNTPQDAQPFAHAQLLSFLRQRSVSGQVAIFVLSDTLHMLQGFTDDENQLIAALNNQKARGYKSSTLQGAGEASARSDSLARAEGNQNGANADPNISFQAISGMLKHMEALESSAMLDRRVEITADALQDISRFLIGLPGRKNLIWLSGSFPNGILPDVSLGSRDSLDVTRNYSSTVVQATDMLNLSHVAVYPVDVRGLQVNPMFDASKNPTFEPGTGRDLKAVRDFARQTSAEHGTMDGIAEQTGGRAFYNTNGLKEAVGTAIDEGAAYYTLSYAPSNATLDGGVRHVRVDLLKPGYRLSYRRTYFADKLDSLVQHAADDPTDPLAATLEHGAPSAHQLFFEAHLQTLGDPAPATAIEMEALSHYEAMTSKSKRAVKLQGKAPVLMQRYLITYGLLTRQLRLVAGTDGAYRGSLGFAVISYDDDGKKLDGIQTKVQDVIQPERFERMQAEGYQMVQTINVPAHAASLRLGVRDVSTSQLGSMEIRLPLEHQASEQK